MMKVALLGFGKMGKAIESILMKNGHLVVLKITSENVDDLTPENIKKADVAIEFSTPESAEKNILFCLKNGVPVVAGTTGWIQSLVGLEERCLELNGTFLYASNFSIGVNIFFEVNERLAQLMRERNEYSVGVEEIHHTQKKDAPSGTAISLAHQIIEELPRIEGWTNDEPAEGVLLIESRRERDVAGTHIVSYRSEIDDIEIRHTAHNRRGFAEGAVQAARFVIGKKGVFTMKDVLFSAEV